MKHTFCAVFLTAAAVLTACQKNDYQGEQPSGKNTTIRATIGDAASTRSSVDYGQDDFTKGEAFKWIANDPIAIRVNNGKLAATKFIGTPVENDQKQATFTGATPSFEGVQTLYAVSPYVAFEAAATTVELDYSASQIQENKSADHIGKTDYMWAMVSGVRPETFSKTDLSFKHLGAMLRIRIRNTSGEACTVKSVTVSEEGDNKVLYDKMELTLADGTVAPVANVATSSKTVLVTDGTQMTDNGTYDVYLMVPPSAARMGANDMFCVNVELLMSDGASTKNKHVDIPCSNNLLAGGFDAGSRYAFSIGLSNLIEYTTIHVPTAGTLATVLGAKTTTITKMKLTGNINAADFSTMNTAMTALTHIEMSNVAVENNSIPSDAFKSNTRIIGIILPNSVTTIGTSAFNGCSGLTGDLVIPNSVTTINDFAFYGCSRLTGTLTIGNSVETIRASTFYGCSGLTGDLVIPNSVKTIGQNAFNGCSGLTGTLTIGNSVTTIGESAFKGCLGFTGTLTIGNLVETIESSAFNGCSGLTGTLTIGNLVKTIDRYAFYSCSGLTGGLVIPNSVTTIGESAFYGCSGLTGTLTIGNSVKTIGSSAFDDCSGLTGDLVIPNSVKTIGSSAFEGCSGLTGDLVIPNSVKTIGSSAFEGCSGFMGTLTIGNLVETIESYAFDGCSGLTGQIVLPISITKLESDAFVGCTNIESFKALWTEAATIPQYKRGMILVDKFIYIPNGTKEDYINKDWPKDQLK